MTEALDVDECTSVGINADLFKPRLQPNSISTPTPPPSLPLPQPQSQSQNKESPQLKSTEITTPPQPTQPSPPLTPPETQRKLDRQQDLSYNLRSSKPVKRAIFAPATRWIPKKTKNCFRDLILSSVDTAKYHSFISDIHAKKLINLANKTTESQIDKFVYESKPFIVISWLTTARIFEYDKIKNQYLEVKRIPERYVKVSPNVITSVHHNESKFYLAHLWANPNDDSADKTKPYIEIRDIFGNSLETPVYYDHVIKSIYSDSNYIYASTPNNLLYIHRKNLFNSAYYYVDFSSLTSGKLIRAYVESIDIGSYSKLKLLSVTTNELLVTLYDAFSHTVVQCFKFSDRDNSKIISLDKIDKLIIIHRNITDVESKYRSVLDFGFMGRVRETEDELFIHESTISFSYNILQVRLQKDNLYVFGHDGSSDNPTNFQIGCIYLPSLKPIWIVGISYVDEYTHILPQDDNIALIREGQQVTSIRTNKEKQCSECKKCKLGFLREKDKTRHERGERTILSKMVVARSRYLEEVGASIFKKLSPLDDPNSSGENIYSIEESCC